ncbi:hypothetical protein U9M48_021039 [Paspalum notatum var. saurae]|uniref:Uncharacterized protein n=1 Tax=Paspalum notatum var. saurae TaxID=547442 RepID=A0AAQ3TFH6_PASNO
MQYREHVQHRLAAMANHLPNGGLRADGGGDQSEPGDLAPQPYGKGAAALRDGFGVNVHRAEPTFPARPGLGAAGTLCVVKANHFFVGLVGEGLHHYDVTISPESTPTKGVYGEVMAKLVSEHQQDDLGGRLVAYDECSSLVTAGSLPFESKEFEVTLSAGDNKRYLTLLNCFPRPTPMSSIAALCGDVMQMLDELRSADVKYKVVIKHAAAISLLQMRMLLAGYPTDIPAQALQVLDMVLREVAFSECKGNGCVAVGQNLGGAKANGLGIEGWKGLYPSLRQVQDGLFVTVDVSSTVSIQPLLLIDFVQNILKIDLLDRNLIKPEYEKLLRALRGVKVEATHRGGARRRYRISGLSVKPTKDLSFEASCGATKTVVDYFRERYNLELKHKFLPCLNVGSEQKLCYVPIEVCKIVPRQCYQKKLEGSQVSTLMNSSIPQANGTKGANESDRKVDDNLTTVEARVLPPPNLKYHDSGSEKTWVPSNGHWNMKEKKVVDGAKINSWACVNFCEDLSEHAVKQFCFKLAEASRRIGVGLADLKVPVLNARPDQVENDLRMCYEEAQNELRGQHIDLLLTIHPDKNRCLYGHVKRICETDIGLVSQCCQRSMVSNKSDQIFANIAIKINAKAGGRNSVIDDVRKSLPIVSYKPTIIFGASVTHPVSTDDSAPSIASVVASQDCHEVAKYNSVVRAQGNHEGIIDGLKEIVTELLHAFGKDSNIKPQQLIFYRGGTSTSQFKQVLEKEIPEIEKASAWKTLYNSEKPQITFIVLQKSHHKRLFPDSNKYKRRLGDKTSVEPGTVVDREICQPTVFDFFLCSHAEIKGPSRPVKYLVLRDDNNFTADELQSLTNNLCYTYASCTQSVSIGMSPFSLFTAPPAYYAQKLAQRAHVYLAQGSNKETAASSGGAAAPAGAPKQLPEIKDELKRSMFYC